MDKVEEFGGPSGDYNVDSNRLEGTQKRQDRDKYFATFVIAILITVISLYLYRHESSFLLIMASQTKEDVNVLFIIVMLATMVLAHLAAEFLRRVCLFWEEWYHLKARYRESRKSAFWASLSIDKWSAIWCGVVAAVCLIVVAVFSGSHGMHCLILIPFYCISYLLLHIFGIWKPRESDLDSLSPTQTHFGHAFAWQYYFGYLKLILPSFLQRVKEFEEAHGVSILVPKLFLLIPESCYSPNLLCDHQADLGKLEFVQNLRELTLDRNGAKGRIYKNPVYRIERDEPIYCCMESVALLNSLHEMCEKEKLTGLTDEKKYEQLICFYSALQQILRQDDELGHLVQLVFYKDTDAAGNQVRISDVVVKNIGLALRNK